MIPILYASTAVNFTNEGLGRLTDCISAKVTEERNGMYELEFRYPVTGKLFNQITQGCFVACIHDDTKTRQPFRVYKRSAELNGIVTFNAEHISYALNRIILKPFTASSCAGAISQIVNQSMNTNPFTFWTDKVVSGDINVSVPTSVRAFLGGTAGSLLDVYGTGEYEFDKFAVKLHLRRGQDTDVEIRYGKNMSELTQEIDSTASYNAIAPYWVDSSSGTVVTLTEGYVMAEDATGDVRAVPVDLSDKFDEAPTESQLRAMATSIVNAGDTWSPTENLKVNFVQLWQTEEYKDVAPLQRLNLCDTCLAIHPYLSLHARIKVITTIYDVLLERYDFMELGSPKATFAETLSQAVEKTILSQVPSTSMLQQAIQHATELITGGLGGYVVINTDADGHPTELLIMDTPDINTAVNVWRWNLGGLGHSSTGYNGQFTTAITADGHIVANFMDTGTLTANILKTGIIQAINGDSYWNLDTGEIYIKAYSDDIDALNDDIDGLSDDIGDLNSALINKANLNGWDVRYRLSSSSESYNKSELLYPDSELYPSDSVFPRAMPYQSELNWSSNMPRALAGWHLWREIRVPTTNAQGQTVYVFNVQYVRQFTDIYNETAKNKAEIKTNSDSIQMTVQRITEVETNLTNVITTNQTQINQRADAIELSASETRKTIDDLGNTVEEIQEATAFLDKTGLHVRDTSNPATQTDIDGAGLEVVDRATGDALLTADVNGVIAKKLISTDTITLDGSHLIGKAMEYYSTDHNLWGIGHYLTSKG